MNQFVYLKNLLFLELISLGYAYALIQKHTTDGQAKVFEASPTPRGAVLVLASADLGVLKAILQTVQTDHRNLVENSWLGENISEKVIEAYLNQVMNPLKENLCLVETDSICEAVKAAAVAVANHIDICEFRLLRSVVHRCVISFSTKQSEAEVTQIFSDMVTTKKVSLQYLPSPAAELRNQYNLE